MADLSSHDLTEEAEAPTGWSYSKPLARTPPYSSESAWWYTDFVAGQGGDLGI